MVNAPKTDERCVACDYELAGVRGERCPECGADLLAMRPFVEARAEAMATDANTSARMVIVGVLVPLLYAVPLTFFVGAVATLLVLWLATMVGFVLVLGLGSLVRWSIAPHHRFYATQAWQDQFVVLNLPWIASPVLVIPPVLERVLDIRDETVAEISVYAYLAIPLVALALACVRYFRRTRALGVTTPPIPALGVVGITFLASCVTGVVGYLFGMFVYLGAWEVLR